MLAATGGGTAASMLTWRRIRRAGRARAEGSADVIVVLGAAVNADGTPCNELTRRLEEAAGLFRAGQGRTILCSGGRGGSGHSEAAAMRDYLLRLGVPRKDLLVDDDGPSTRRAVAAARRHGLDRGRILFVSSHYHMHRILREAERQMLDADGHACAPAQAPSRRSWPRSRGRALLQAVREVAAVWWYALAPSVQSRAACGSPNRALNP